MRYSSRHHQGCIELLSLFSCLCDYLKSQPVRVKLSALLLLGYFYGDDDGGGGDGDGAAINEPSSYHQ